MICYEILGPICSTAWLDHLHFVMPSFHQAQSFFRLWLILHLKPPKKSTTRGGQITDSIWHRHLQGLDVFWNRPALDGHGTNQWCRCNFTYGLSLFLLHFHNCRLCCRFCCPTFAGITFGMGWCHGKEGGKDEKKKQLQNEEILHWFTNRSTKRWCWHHAILKDTVYIVDGFKPFEKILVKLDHLPRKGWKEFETTT